MSALARPFLPSDRPPPDPRRTFNRAAFSIAVNALDGHLQGPTRLIEDRWPNDKAALALTKAATSPASATTWGSELLPIATGGFVGSLVGESAAARLITAGTRVSLNGVY